jgi:hypothetical protein
MKKIITQLLFMVALVVLPHEGSAQVVNGTFDVNNPGFGFYCGNIYGWTRSNINGTNDDTQWENQWNPNGDTWWVDITGCGWGNDKWIQQVVPTTVGAIHTLYFDLGYWHGQYYTDAGVDVYVNDNFVGHYDHEEISGNQLSWKTFSYCFVAEKANTKIRFKGAADRTVNTPAWCTPISNYVGVIGLDNVKLVKENMQIVHETNCLPAVLTQLSTSGGAGQWYINGQPAGTDPTLQTTVPGTYRLVYSTNCGEITDEVVMIDCQDVCPMGANFNITNLGGTPGITYCAGQWLRFNGFSTIPVPLRYQWDFGDGTTSGTGFTTDPTAYHMYPNPGIYNVCMTVGLAPGETNPSDDCDKTLTYKVCWTVIIRDCPDGWSDKMNGAGDTHSGGDMLMEYPSLDVFPNPATDMVTVQGLMTEDTDVILSVYNIAGELVYEQPVAAGTTETTCSIKTFDAGVYLLKISGKTYYKDVKLIKH